MGVWRLVREQAQKVPTLLPHRRKQTHAPFYFNLCSDARWRDAPNLIPKIYPNLNPQTMRYKSAHTRVKSWSLANRKSVDKALHDNT